MTAISRQAARPRIDTYPGRDNHLAISVNVNDVKVEQEAQGFDRMERAFALIPTPTNHGVEWKRHDLNWGGTDRMGSQPKDWEDMHWLRLVVDDDTRELVRQQGVAFGLETNVGTLWLQEPGDNTRR